MNEAKIEGGAVLIARQIVESEIFYNKPDKWLKMWLYIICRVAFKDDKKYKRGELFLKYEWICERTGASKGQIDKFIRWAKSVDMLSTRKSTRGFIVKVNNYQHYQTLDNYYYNIPVDTENAFRSTDGRNKVDTIQKNDKNDKNDILATASVAEEKKEIAQVIKMFEIVNPSISSLYSNKTQRAAAERLLAKWSIEQINAVVKILPKLNADRYAKGKSITPYELEKNLGHIKAYIEQHNQSNRIVKI